MLAGDLAAAVDLVLPEAEGFAEVSSLGMARQVEYLTRGVNASYLGSNRAYVDWRLLGTDPGNVAELDRFPVDPPINPGTVQACAVELFRKGPLLDCRTLSIGEGRVIVPLPGGSS